jgi:hypothetical protein
MAELVGFCWAVLLHCGGIMRDWGPLASYVRGTSVLWWLPKRLLSPVADDGHSWATDAGPRYLESSSSKTLTCLASICYMKGWASGMLSLAPLSLQEPVGHLCLFQDSTFNGIISEARREAWRNIYTMEMNKRYESRAFLIHFQRAGCETLSSPSLARASAGKTRIQTWHGTYRCKFQRMVTLHTHLSPQNLQRFPAPLLRWETWGFLVLRDAAEISLQRNLNC